MTHRINFTAPARYFEADINVGGGREARRFEAAGWQNAVRAFSKQHNCCGFAQTLTVREFVNGECVGTKVFALPATGAYAVESLAAFTAVI